MGLDDEIVTRVRADTTDFDRGMQHAQQSAQRMAGQVDVGARQMSAGYRGAATAMLGASNALSGLTGQAPAAVQRFQMIGIQVATMGSALSTAGGAVGALGMALNRAFPILALIGGAVTVATVAWNAWTKSKKEATDAEEEFGRVMKETSKQIAGRALLVDSITKVTSARFEQSMAEGKTVEESLRAQIALREEIQRRIRVLQGQEITGEAAVRIAIEQADKAEAGAAEATRERAKLAVEDAFARARSIGATAMTEEELEELEEAAKARAAAASAMAELGTGAERTAASMAMLRQAAGELPDAEANAAQRATEHMREWETAIDAVTVAHQSLGMVLGSSVAAALDVHLGKSIQLVHADRAAAQAAKAMELSKGEAAKVAARDAIKAIAAQATVKAAFMYAEAAAMAAAAYFGYAPGAKAAASALVAAAGYTALAGIAAGAVSQIGPVRRTIPAGAGARGGVGTGTDPFGRAGFGGGEGGGGGQRTVNIQVIVPLGGRASFMRELRDLEDGNRRLAAEEGRA